MKDPSPASNAISSYDNDEDTVWEESLLGPLTRWPESLRAYFLTICALPHPSALFWGEKQILLRNKPWIAAQDRIKGQGQSQRGNLSNKLRETLQSVVDNGQSQELRAGSRFVELASGRQNISVAILSQLPPHGVLVQLVHSSTPDDTDFGPPSNTEWDVYQQTTIQAKETANEESGRPGDDVAVDEHPFFRRFAELLPSGLAILDRDAKALFVNRRFWELTTLQDDGQFTSWPQSIHSEDYDRVMKAYREAFSQQQELRIEFRAKDAPQPWRLLLLTPLGDEKEHHISTRDRGGFICSIVDISSEKSAELAERNAAQQARERKEQQERFIDMISHEIRNPLSAVLHCAEDIGEAIGQKGSAKSDVDVDMIREALATIHLCVRHQKSIVDDVLSFSKLDASLLSLKPTVAEPSKALDTTLKIFKHEFRKQNVTFDYVVEPEYTSMPVERVMADMPRVGQVLINLMTNAIKFTTKHKTASGEKRISCSVSASKTRPESYPPDVVFFRTETSTMDATNSQEWGNGDSLYIMVAVKDSGIGISKANQERLFERFRQATPMTNEQYGGSGLGLNISRKICQLHGGEVGVSSTEGKGSTFGFFFKVKLVDASAALPAQEDEQTEARLHEKSHAGIRQAADESDLRAEPFEWKPSPTEARAAYFDDSDSQESNQKSKSQADSSSASPVKHILLVEDNKINQRLLLRKLEKKGFRVTTANNGQEAVAKVKELPGSRDKSYFDIILMDKEMPLLDGNAATREIRGLEQRTDARRAPVIGVTANVRDEQQEEMIASGMDDVITKPYEIDEMVAKIHKATISQEGGKKPAGSQPQLK